MHIFVNRNKDFLKTLSLLILFAIFSFPTFANIDNIGIAPYPEGNVKDHE